MQALLRDLAWASDETTTQLSILTGFRVTACMAEGDSPHPAATMFLPEQMEIRVEAIRVAVGNDVTSEDGVDRVSMLAEGLREGRNLMRVHCRNYPAKAFVLANEALLATLNDEDLKEYCQLVFAAAVSVAKTAPSMIENMPGVVVPTWPTLSYYIHRGGLIGAKAGAAAAWETGRDEKCERSVLSGAAGARDCWAWMEKAGCHFEYCVYNHPPSK